MGGGIGCQMSTAANGGIGNNPGPEDQALFSLQMGAVNRQITNGMMECWKNGILGMKNGRCPDFIC